MKTAFLSFAVLIWGIASAQAQLPAADDLLRTARYVATLQDANLKGSLQKSGVKGKVPIELFLLQGQGIEFQVHDGKQWNKFQLKLTDEEYDLFEGVGNKIRRFDRAKLTKPVMGTDLTYEDLSMAFLYWPNGKTLKEESLGFGRDSWMIRLVNPKAKGEYKTVDVWVHKDSGALMQIYGYRADGKCIKIFKVTEVMKVGKGQYSIKTMKVQSYDDNGRTKGITSLNFDKPKALAPKGLQ